MTAGATIPRRDGIDSNGVGLEHLRRMYPEIKRVDAEFLAAHGFSSVESYLASGRAPPPGTVVKSIKSSGGDYTTFANWEAAISADPAEDQTGQLDEVMNGGTVTVNVANANSVTFTLTVGSSYRYDQGASWPALAKNEGGWITTTSSTVAPVHANTSNVVVEWLQFDSGANDRNRAINCTSGSVVVRFCICLNIGLYQNSAGGSGVVHHCMGKRGLQNANRVVVQNVASTTVTLYNISWLNQNDGTFSAIYRTSGTLNIYNSIVLTITGSANIYSGTIGGDYNMSSDGTAPGATAWLNVTPSDIFQDVGDGTEDLHLQSSNDGTYEGGDYSGTIGSLDIDGDTRVDWDIGADEIPGAPPPTTINLGALAGAGVLNPPSVAPGALTVSPGVLSAQAALNDPTLSPGALSLALDVLDAVAALPQVSLLPGSRTISPDVLVAEAVVNPVTVSPAGVSVGIAALQAQAAALAPSLSPGAKSIALAILEAAGALASPNVGVPPIALHIGVLAARGELLPPALTPGAVTLELDALDAAGALLGPALVPQAHTIALDVLRGIAVVQAPGTAPGAVTVNLGVLSAIATLLDIAVSTTVIVVGERTALVDFLHAARASGRVTVVASRLTAGVSWALVRARVEPELERAGVRASLLS